MAFTSVVEYGDGATNSNSYCSLATAENYWDSRLYPTTWDAATDADKRIALSWASRLLDQLLKWSGYKYDEDQAIQWPRDGAYDRAGYAIDSDEIPTFLQEAVAEFAAYLIASDRTAENATKGFSRIKAGTVDVTINKWDRQSTIPNTVFTMVDFCAVKASNRQRFLVRA